jgi:hypothetical protein
MASPPVFSRFLWGAMRQREPPLEHSEVFHRRISVIAGFVQYLSKFSGTVGMSTRLWIPSSIVKISESYFRDCASLASVTFDPNCKLSQLKSFVFCLSGLAAIHLPGSAEVICGSCFV